MILAGCAPAEMTFARKASLWIAGGLACALPLAAGLSRTIPKRAVPAQTPVVIAQAIPPAPAPVSPKPVPAAASPAPAFEAVSIKPIVGALYPGVWAKMSGSRISIEAMTVGNLIDWAYGVEDYEILGGPAWTGSAQRYDSAIRYNIEAKADGDEPRTREQFAEMIKTMLADRFQLTMHHEQKEMPVYALVVDKGGPKFQESGPESPHTMLMGGPRCCSTKLTADGIGMSMLAGQFNNVNGSDRPVLDETGLKGEYKFTLEWEMPQPGRESTGPNIFTAMKDQLGLKFEPKTGQVDVLVIDRVEKPPEN